MIVRTTTRKITFPSPFVISDSDSPHPAGAYVLETDEEQVEGLSFVAYRRTSMRLHLPVRPGIVETVAIAADDLAHALGAIHER